MKGFPLEVAGPLGPWFRKVNETVRAVREGMSRTEVIELLGEPDDILKDARTAGGQLQTLMEQVAGGPTLIHYGDKEPCAEVLVYRDPYRPRKQYSFAIRDGMVSEISYDRVVKVD